MNRYVGRIFLGVLGVAVAVAVFALGDSRTVVAGTEPFQRDLFQFTDAIVTAGLIAGGSATIHGLMAFIEDLLKANRIRGKDS